jgi:hypothetical protein
MPPRGYFTNRNCGESRRFRSFARPALTEQVSRDLDSRTLC